MNTFFISAVSFFAGAIVGYVFKDVVKSKFQDDASQRTFILVIVGVIWTLSTLYDMVSPTYETSPLIHGIMGTIGGFFFWKPKGQNDR